MKKIAYSSLAYMIFGLAAGLFYREFPRMINVVGEVQDSQLSVVHTHAFALGMFVFLFVLIFAKLFNIHKHPHFNKFYLTYHIGVGVSTLTMLAHGIYVELGKAPHAAFSGIAGLGHIVLTIAFALFFYVLIGSINENETNA